MSTRQDPDGEVTVVANSYRGLRLNRPNDVVVKSDGSLYFTNPGAPEPGLDLDYSGVYMVSPDLGTITLLVRDFIFPNGLAFSTDESIPLHRRLASGTHQGLRRAAQRHPVHRQRPRPVRSEGRQAGRARTG